MYGVGVHHMPEAKHRETVLAIVTGLLILFLIFRKDWLLYSGANKY